MNREDKDKNPWLRISPTDYEGHMGPGGVDQLGVLEGILEQVYNDVRPNRMLILGCGTGNGFRHVSADVTSRLVGVDINPAYLELARERYPHLKKEVELVCCYAEKCDFAPASFDLVHAALLLEYLDVEPMVRKIASWLASGGVASFVLQEPVGEDGAVSQTSYQSLQALSGVMHLLSPEVLGRIAGRHGLKERKSWEVELKRGKKFFVAEYVRE